jgi:succinyl-diaminopimelate desuccinylase
MKALNDSPALFSLEHLLDLSRQLIAIPSVSNQRQECHRALDWVDQQLSGCGFHRVDFEYNGFRSLIFSTRPSKRAKLILNCHLDVVAAADHQFQLTERDGKWWGRGTYDMKTAAIAFMVMAQKLSKLPVDQQGDVQFQFVTDEEIGGHRGSERLSEEGYTADLVIAGEPTDLGICYQAKGVYWVVVHLAGTPGHAARPWLSDNPLDRMQTGLNLLREIYPAPSHEVWRTTATPTGITAGDSHNRIPDQVQLKLDIRHLPEESPDDIEATLLRCFPGARIEVIQRSYAHQSDPNHPLIQRLAKIQEETIGFAPRMFSEHFASDTRYWSRLGVPAICWGPSGAGMHADDEHLEPQSLVQYLQVLDRVVAELGQ